MFVVFVTPFFNDNAIRFFCTLASVPGVRAAAVCQEPEAALPDRVRAQLSGHYRVGDALDGAEVTRAARWLAAERGPIHRILAINEYVQVQVAEAREALGVEGLGVEVAKNFRDKARMKDILRAASVPCARHTLAAGAEGAWRFAGEVGYPVIMKPPAGAGARSTYRIEGPEGMARALAESAPSAASPVVIEEMVTGEEHSFDAVVIDGKPIWSSLTRYLPTPLEAMENPWIQWCVLLPREIDDPRYDAIREHGFRALAALGLDTGICHMEWFRRADGSVMISEVGARPGGAQIVTLASRAHDFDLYGEWAQLMLFGTFDPPEARRYAAGAAFLRAQGEGTIKAVWGLDRVERELGHLVTDVSLPVVGRAKSESYEGDGYILVKHEDTRVVEEALGKIIRYVRVEAG